MSIISVFQKNNTSPLISDETLSEVAKFALNEVSPLMVG